MWHQIHALHYKLRKALQTLRVYFAIKRRTSRIQRHLLIAIEQERVAQNIITASVRQRSGVSLEELRRWMKVARKINMLIGELPPEIRNTEMMEKARRVCGKTIGLSQKAMIEYIRNTSEPLPEENF